MKLIKLSLVLLLALPFLPTQSGAVVVPKPVTEQVEETPVANEAAAENSQLSKREQRKLARQQRKELRQELRQQLKDARRSGAGGAELILLVLLALIIAPLSMFIYDGGASGRFWVSLVLWGAGVILWGTLGALGLLASAVYTLYIILSESL